jgi:hypothetical protein
MKYTVYNPLTGEILELLSISNPDIVEEILQDKSYVEGHYDSDIYYIDQGQPCAKAPQPSHEYIQYQFDWTTKSWLVNQDYSIVVCKQQRNNLLSAVDCVNPIRYAGLTAEQQQELIAYRQALLDVPQQTGFPTAVSWPAKPAWL